LLQHSAFSDSYEGIVWSKNISRVGYVLLGDDVAREWGYDQAKSALHMWDWNVAYTPKAAAIQSMLKEL